MQEEGTENGIDHRRERVVIYRTLAESLKKVLLNTHHSGRAVPANLNRYLLFVITHGNEL